MALTQYQAPNYDWSNNPFYINYDRYDQFRAPLDNERWSNQWSQWQDQDRSIDVDFYRSPPVDPWIKTGVPTTQFMESSLTLAVWSEIGMDHPLMESFSAKVTQSEFDDTIVFEIRLVIMDDVEIWARHKISNATFYTAPNPNLIVTDAGTMLCKQLRKELETNWS